MEKKYKIFKGHNMFEILQYFLLTEDKERFFLFNTRVLPKSLKEKIKKRYPSNVKYIIENQEKNIFLKMLKRIYIDFYYSFIFILKNKNLKNCEMMGDLSDVRYFQKNFKISILEDGLGTYLAIIGESKEEIIKFKFLRSIYNMLVFQNSLMENNYTDKRIYNIYLTDKFLKNKLPRRKICVINLKKLWNKKSDIEKEEILNIFGFDKNIINSIKNRKYILYTQPLSEDEVLLENEKIELYSKILKKYDKNCIVLKKHPREKTNYKKIFPDIEVMDQVFPAELLTLLDIHFEKAITIFSTAALTDSKVKVDFYGTEIHPKLFERFGSQDTIMKRNAFLDEEEKK